MQLAEDFSLLDNVKPVMVIGDFRLTMGIAARKAGIPYGNLANAYWSRYARPEYMVPDLPAVRLFGSRLSQRIFNLVRPLAFAVHARPLRTLYREHGLSVADASLGELYTTGDVRLFSDVPGLYRGRNFPDSCCFIGPVAWAPEIATPQWWGNLHPERPTAYIYLGSSGDQSLLPSIVNALSSAGLQCIVAGGAADIDKNSGAVFTAPMLPGGVAAERADIVVCNGGSPSSYQALAAGKPVLGIASNLDQYLNMRFVEACGAGITMRSDGFRAGALQDSVRRLLSESGFRNQAARLRDEIQATDTEQIFTTIIKQHAHSASTS
ncbi:MAG: glycosyl transferase [Rhodocyclaceae bacterium]|nr:glycosyl transferase [Rhodocyclaceae bacterium]